MDVLRLVEAFVTSRVTYVLPYAVLTKAEKDKLEALMHKAYRLASVGTTCQHLDAKTRTFGMNSSKLII